MIHTARACGLSVMMGCMLESSLGIAPAAHLASLLDYADLDGAALLASDPFVGPGLDGPTIRDFQTREGRETRRRLSKTFWQD